MTKNPDQVAAKATDFPREPEGEGALPVELTDLSLEELMALQVSGHAHLDPEDPGAIDGLQPTGTLTGALPIDVIDLTELDLAELMTLRVSAGVYEDLPEDLTTLDLADLMTLGVSAGPSEESGDEENKEPEDEGENLVVAAGEEQPVGETEQASEDESDADEAAVLSSGGEVIDPDFEPIDDETLIGSASDDVLTGDGGGADDGLVADVATVENFDSDGARSDDTAEPIAATPEPVAVVNNVGAVSDANGASNSVAENAANGTTVGIKASASDADGSDTVTYTLSNDAGGRFAIDGSSGVVTVADGTLLDYETATSHLITVLATSSDGSTSSQAYTVNLTDANDAPMAVDDSATTNEDTALTISAASLLANDSDVDLDTLSITGFTQGANGTVVDNGDGTFTYTPNLGFAGSDFFTYTVSDGNGDSDTATVTVVVNDSTPNVITGPGFHIGTDGFDEITGTSLSEAQGGEEIIFGAGGNDILVGNGNEDRLIGAGGNDELYGGAGGDFIFGGPGDDIANGGADGDVYVFREGDGNDVFSGGSGQDSILLTAAAGGAPNLADWSLNLASGTATWFADRIDLSSGAVGTVTFSDGSTIAFDGVERIDWGSSYSIDSGNSVVHVAGAGGDIVTGGTTEDTIVGGTGNDTLNGNDNEDLLLGGAGDDSLSGGNQNDMLVGGDGSDTLDGGAGNDALVGGAGDDILVWDSADTTIDGGSGADTLLVASGDIDLTAFAGTITGIELIDLETDIGTNAVTLTVSDVLDMSDTDILTIDGDVGDSIDAGTGWTDSGVVGAYHVYTQGLATLNVDTDMTVNLDIV